MPLAAHGTDDQRFHVLPFVMCPRTEDRFKRPREREASECVDGGFGCHVVKGNVSSLVVQEDAHASEGLPYLQVGWGNGGHLVLVLPHHHHHPVAPVW